MFSIAENAKVVSVYPPKDRTGAAMTTEWISMKNAEKCTFILHIGTQTSTSAYAVTLAVARDASGTNAVTVGASTDLGFPYYYINSGDTLTKTTVSSSTFNVASTIDSKFYIIEVKAEDMGTLTSTSVVYDADYVRLSAATPGAHACLTSCIAILTGYRYQQSSPPTAIT